MDKVILTLITTLCTSATKPYAFTLREGSNTAIDFLNSIKAFAAQNLFKPGDYLILDNARVHDSQEIILDLDNLATQYGLYIRFLPSYSPELNPCELIFAQVKNYIRNNRIEEDFTTILVLAFQTISFFNVIQYYSKCIIPSKITSF